MNVTQLFSAFSSFAVFFLDKEGQIVDGNPSAWALFKNQPFPKNIFTELIKNSKNTSEGWFTRADETKFFINYEVSIRPDAAGYILIALDQTVEKQKSEINEKFFSMSLDMLSLASMDGYFLRVNPAFTKTLGYTEAELCSKPVTEFIHPDDIQRTIDEIVKQQKGSTVWSFENRYRTKDGKYKWLSWKSIPDGHIMYGAARDVTEIKELNANLEARVLDRTLQLSKAQKFAETLQQRTEAILKNAPLTLWSIDKNGVFEFYEGRGLEEIPDRNKKQIGNSIFRVTVVYPRLNDAVIEALAGKKSDAVTKIKDRFYKTIIIPQFDTAHAVTGAVGVTTDVTAEVNQDAERRKWEEIFERAPWGIAIATSEHRISMVNPAFVKMHGGKASEWIGQLASKMYSEEKAIEHRERAKNIARENRLSFESEHIKTDGTSFPVRSDLSLIRDDYGNPLYVVGNFFDLTNSKKADREIREAQEASKLKSTFLANMSHEIRTPINGVIGMTHLLKDTHLDEEQKDLCENISRSADSLLTVINDILDFSKVEAGKLEIEYIAFDLQDMVNEVIRTLTFAAQKKSIVLRLQLENPLTQLVLGDPGRIRQVLNNLLSNAIKFTSVGFVTLRVSADVVDETARLRFEIQDTGIGIANDAQEKLFQSFNQADSSTTRKFGGSGLGLSISKGLVDLMGGEIGVISKARQGSTFWFTLNVKLSKASTLKKESTEKFNTKSKFKNAYILVAEDNQINQLVAIKMLEKMGFKPQAVANGHEVLKALRERDFDLILMDCQMPELDGYDTTKALRQLGEAKFENIPVIAMTANAVAGDKEKCLAAGMNDYISKPVEPGALFQVVEKWLAKSHST
ncbi:hypothetical protein CIK05_05925 [Bdellovibrio sp. qaytius]|nr:hypothetical protein CIK05_05925 [Bdellovibrio sp. qaytius]